MGRAPKAVIELVEHFERNIDSFKGQGYNEAQVRKEFIDPFFDALGWDIANKQGIAEAYKDVIHEDAIKIGGETKAPDYCFRIGGTRKFFLEAKKPAVDIADNEESAYQLRRYAWSAKLPLSILTNFEKFAVYDCLVRPQHTERANTARTIYMTYKDYVEQWDEIAQIFSKDAVLKGSFDKYAAKAEGKRGTSTVDKEFLKEIEGWRRELATYIARKNRNLGTAEVSFAVQRTIDRILFLRMCEDWGIESYGQLMALKNGSNIYQRLGELFEKADAKYNSGLFYFKPEKGRHEPTDELTLGLDVPDEPIGWILNNLYYPQPYDFRVFPAEILGNVYEQFLGKVIRITPARTVKVEDKPEVKKAGGVYYTPEYIVSYIVKNTVGKLCEGKTPNEISKLRILDPACGSGSFLLGAYTYLLNYHRDWYVDNAPKKHTKQIYQGRGGQWYLTIKEKKQILTNNIYGVDIDFQAVEVTKLSLLLKVLEGENQETVGSMYKISHERALPDLGDNIKCGNSLIGTDFYQMPETEKLGDEERKLINAFDWEKEFQPIFKQGGFDAVIGNPPYGADLSKPERRHLEKHFKLGTTDTAALFMGQQNLLLKNKGIGGFIIPKPFTYASNWEEVRNSFLGGILQIVDVSKVWKEVKLEQTIYVYQKGVKTPEYISSVREEESINEVGKIQKSLCQKYGFIVNGVKETEIKIADKLQKQGCFLKNLVVNQRGGMLQEYVTSQNGDFKVLGGKQINRYVISEQAKGLISKKHIDGKNAFIKPKSILTQNIIAHIQNPVDHIKITSTIPKKTSYVILDTINQLENISQLSSYYLLGILNSNLINWYVYRFIFAKAIRTMHFDSPVTDRIPYPQLNIKENANKTKHDKMVKLVERMLDLHNKLGEAKVPMEKERLQREIDATDKQIDTLVYDLYGLTADEIAIVEGRDKTN